MNFFLSNPSTEAEWREFGAILSEFEREQSKLDVRIILPDTRAMAEIIREAKKINHQVMLARCGGRLAGFCWAYLGRNGKATVGMIQAIYVRKKYRRQALGAAMLTRMIAWFKTNNAARMNAQVITGNTQASHLLMKFGLKPTMTQFSRTFT